MNKGFMNQLKKRELRSQGLWPPKKDREPSIPSNIISILPTTYKHRFAEIEFVDERKGTEEFENDE